MKDKYMATQRVLLTEQDSELNKKMSMLGLTIDADLGDLPQLDIDAISDYVLTDFEILKYYEAAHISEVLAYCGSHGLPTSVTAYLKKEYFSRLSNVTNIDELGHLTTALQNDISENISNYNTSGFSYLVSQAVQYIHLMRFQPLSANDVADHLHINRAYLSKEFHKEVGSKLIDYIHMVKLDFADRMIASHEYSLTEIADLLGYSSYHYFAKVYKRYRGVSPSGK